MGAEESKPVEHLHEVERRLLVHAGVPIRVRDLLLPREQESIHYAYCEGRGEVGKGKPLVMVHGYASGIGVYYRILKFIVERWKGPIYLLDLPGMGASMRKEKKFTDPQEVEHFFIKRLRYWVETVLPYSDEMAAKLAAKLSKSNSSGGGTSSPSNRGPPAGNTPPVVHEKFVLLAHSFGGYLSTALANSIKHRIAGLVLLSPCFGFPKSRQPKEDEEAGGFHQRAIELTFDIAEAGGGIGVVKKFGSWGGYFFRQWVRNRFATPPPEQEFDALVDYLVGINYDAAPGTESALTAVFGRYLVTKADIPLIERVDLDGVPLISFYGDDDWMDKQGASYLGDVGVITGCTHQLHMEYPRLVCRCIMYFIKHNIDEKDEEKAVAREEALDKMTSAERKEERQAERNERNELRKQQTLDDMAGKGRDAYLDRVNQANEQVKQNASASGGSTSRENSPRGGDGERKEAGKKKDIGKSPKSTSFQIPEEPSDEEKDSKNKASASGAGASAQFKPQARGAGAGKPSSTGNSKLSQEGKGPILSKTPVATINEGDEENEQEQPDSTQSLDLDTGAGEKDKELDSAAMQAGSAKSRASIKKFHAEARASVGGRTPGVWIYPEAEVTKSNLQMNAVPSYSRRPYKKVLKIRNRAPVWWIPNEQSDGVNDIREFRKDYDPSRPPAAEEDDAGAEKGIMGVTGPPRATRQPKVPIDIKVRTKPIDQITAETGGAPVVLPAAERAMSGESAQPAAGAGAAVVENTEKVPDGSTGMKSPGRLMQNLPGGGDAAGENMDAAKWASGAPRAASSPPNNKAKSSSKGMKNSSSYSSTDKSNMSSTTSLGKISVAGNYDLDSPWPSRRSVPSSRATPLSGQTEATDLSSGWVKAPSSAAETSPRNGKEAGKAKGKGQGGRGGKEQQTAQKRSVRRQLSFDTLARDTYAEDENPLVFVDNH